MGVGRRFTEFLLLPRLPLAVQFGNLQNFLVVVKKISGLADDTMTSFSIADAQPRAAVSSLQDGGSSKAWKIAKRHQHAAESWHGERLHHLRRKLIVLSVRCFLRAPRFPHWDPWPPVSERSRAAKKNKASKDTTWGLIHWFPRGNNSDWNGEEVMKIILSRFNLFRQV